MKDKVKRDKEQIAALNDLLTKAYNKQYKYKDISRKLISLLIEKLGDEIKPEVFEIIEDSYSLRKLI